MPSPVLIVDDDPETLSMIDALLRASGHATVLARNGRNALERARDYAPSVIVLDLMMPVMDGMQFREAQRADASIAAIPVVVCSAHPRALQMGCEIGAAGVFQKAGDIDHLMELVDRHSAPKEGE